MIDIYEYFGKLFMEDMEKEIKEIANLPKTEGLEQDYNGKRFKFKKGATPFDVFNKLWKIYRGYNMRFFNSKDVYEVFLELKKNNDGFLSEVIQKRLMWKKILR